MDTLLFQIALIGAAGIGAQWLAWALRIPAIALLLVAGFLMGPVFGIMNPKEIFGDVYKPAIALAVAIILFEGGLTLNFKEIKETSSSVQRIIFLGGPLVWLFSTLAAHYGGGLSWSTSTVIGAILVITGPTVIIPLLRNAQLRRRPASLLRWEAIVNDPIGALYAVLAFEVFLVLSGSVDAFDLLNRAALAALVAVGGAWLFARLLAYVFVRGWVGEYLKAPVLFASVLFAFAVSDSILKESGLLTVTIMGITLANTRLASLTEMRRFKETVTVLLVSGLFVMLTASLTLDQITTLGWRDLVFALLVLFVCRPAAIWIATIGSDLDWRERLLVSWIAPRGIVAVAVSGLFGTALVEAGVPDAERMTVVAFAIVASTILLHGFSLSPLAKMLGLKTADQPGILFVGGSSWTIALAEKLKSLGVPVMIADENWDNIKAARLKEIPVHYGQILSEAAHHHIELNRFSYLVAITPNEAYNSLVCTEFAPELGRGNVYQLGSVEESERKAMAFTIGGRTLFNPPKHYRELRERRWKGEVFSSTKLTETYDMKAYAADRPYGTDLVMWIKDNGTIQFASRVGDDLPAPGDVVIAFGPKQADDLSVHGAESEENKNVIRERARKKAKEPKSKDSRAGGRKERSDA